MDGPRLGVHESDEVEYYDSVDASFEIGDSIESFTLSKLFANQHSQYNTDEHYNIRKIKFYQTVQLIDEFDRNQPGAKIKNIPV